MTPIEFVKALRRIAKDPQLTLWTAQQELKAAADLIEALDDALRAADRRCDELRR